MKEINILYLYPDILDLYGDTGNINVLTYRLKMRGIKFNVDTYSIKDEKPDFNKYDIVFLGGGADLEQQILAKDLTKYKKEIQESIKNGVFYLLICGGYQLFGHHYKDSNGEVIEGLGIFDYYTEASLDKSKRCIGNIIIETELNNKKYKVIGFENHGGQTYNIKTPFGEVLKGNGNLFNSEFEGFKTKNVIATYLHGPLLSKNPLLADYILEYALKRKYKEIKLQELDDELENKCREQLFTRFL